MHDFRVSAHRFAGLVALGITALFWVGSIFALAFGSEAILAGMKLTILYGIAFQLMALLVAGLTGRLLAINRLKEPPVARKLKRMLAAGAISFVVLLPSAVYLALKIQGGSPDFHWKLAQAAELVAGAAVIILLVLNARDGFALGREKARS
jgi:hypothetical protein